jgi:hypothetical protein
MDEEFEAVVPNDAKPSDTDYVGFRAQTAHTSDASRPRALAMGYFPGLYKLIIIFRGDVWWEYHDVPPDIWRYLKNADSTGRALSSTNGVGLDNWHSMGPADRGAMSQESIARLSSLAAYAPRIQKRSR